MEAVKAAEGPEYTLLRGAEEPAERMMAAERELMV
jgi:hypothetical protein